MDSAGLVSAANKTSCGYGVTCTPNNPHRGVCPESYRYYFGYFYDEGRNAYFWSASELRLVRGFQLS